MLNNTFFNESSDNNRGKSSTIGRYLILNYKIQTRDIIYFSSISPMVFFRLSAADTILRFKRDRKNNNGFK